MRWTLRRKSTEHRADAPRPPLTLPRPLSESEIQVLRDQYEKEGDMASVQTKFNFAWVRPHDPHPPLAPPGPPEPTG